jgi:hypothetical protein
LVGKKKSCGRGGEEEGVAILWGEDEDEDEGNVNFVAPNV